MNLKHAELSVRCGVAEIPDVLGPAWLRVLLWFLLDRNDDGILLSLRLPRDAPTYSCILGPVSVIPVRTEVLQAE